MAAIKISDLNPAGASFFSGSESYLNDLTTDEMVMAVGGSSAFCVWSAGLFAIGGRAKALGEQHRKEKNPNQCRA